MTPEERQRILNSIAGLRLLGAKLADSAAVLHTELAKMDSALTLAGAVLDRAEAALAMPADAEPPARSAGGTRKNLDLDVQPDFYGPGLMNMIEDIDRAEEDR